jgi:acyl-CoA reductase-like NAD-dependent aldehyde dehydrogenase
MKTLRSYVRGNWHEASLGFVTLVDPSTEEEIAQASSQGIDFGAVLDYARERGGPALRAMTFAQRAQLLKDMSKVLRDHRDELLDLSARNTGTVPSTSTAPPAPSPTTPASAAGWESARS